MSAWSRGVWWIRGLLLTTGLSTLGIGAQHMFTSTTNLSPTTMSYTDFLKTRPSDKWLQLNDAWVDYRFAMGIGPIDQFKKVEVHDYYVPVFALADDPGRVSVFLKCNDAQSLALAKEAVQLPPMGEEQVMQWLQNNEGRMHLKKSIKGVVLYGLADDSASRDVLAKGVGGRLDPNFIILDENQEPQGAYGLLLLIGGIVLLASLAGTFFIGHQLSQPMPVYRAHPASSYPDSPLASNAYQPPPQASIPLKRDGTRGPSPGTRRQQNPASPERPPWE